MILYLLPLVFLRVLIVVLPNIAGGGPDVLVMESVASRLRVQVGGKDWAGTQGLEFWPCYLCDSGDNPSLPGHPFPQLQEHASCIIV